MAVQVVPMTIQNQPQKKLPVVIVTVLADLCVRNVRGVVPFSFTVIWWPVLVVEVMASSFVIHVMVREV